MLNLAGSDFFLLVTLLVGEIGQNETTLQHFQEPFQRCSIPDYLGEFFFNHSVKIVQSPLLAF